jgi:hypothetical protein
METTYGEVLSELPQGFIPREQWPEYLLTASPPPTFKPEAVGENPRGMRWGLWPLTFEEYITDLEPDLAVSDPDHLARNRIVLWRRLTRTDIPKGWHQFSKKPSRLEGIAEIKNADYWRRWDESARRYRRRWVTNCLNKIYTIAEVPYEEFAHAYMQSTVVKKVGRETLNIAKRRIEQEKNELRFTECWGVRRMSDDMLMAGMVITNSPSCGGSYYLCGFYKAEVGEDPLMMGLMDNWFSISLKRGIRFLHFGGFWIKGDPKNWKGFSIFKSKFGLFYLYYPPLLLRIVRGKFF